MYRKILWQVYSVHRHNQLRTKEITKSVAVSALANFATGCCCLQNFLTHPISGRSSTKFSAAVGIGPTAKQHRSLPDPRVASASATDLSIRFFFWTLVRKEPIEEPTISLHTARPSGLIKGRNSLLKILLPALVCNRSGNGTLGCRDVMKVGCHADCRGSRVKSQKKNQRWKAQNRKTALNKCTCNQFCFQKRVTTCTSVRGT